MPYASNVRISTPISIAAQPDVDFNGFQFSYTVGIMFPAQAAINTNYIAPPPISTLTKPANPSGGLH